MKKTKTILIWSILLVASIFDARYYKIPNQLIVLGFLLGILVNLIEFRTAGIVYFIIKASWPFVLLLLLRLCRKTIGMGDVKLFCVVSTMLDTEAVINLMVTSVMLAGIIIILRCLYERQFVKRQLHYSFYITAAFFLLQVKS